MDSDGPRPSGGSAPTWSAVAGAFEFLCAVAVLLLLSPVVRTLTAILTLPGAYGPVVMAVPAAVVGAATWWAVVERRGDYRYRAGSAAGLLTVVGTVLVWLVVFAVVWGPGLVLTGWFVVAFVLVVTAPFGALAGLPLSLARRRLSDGRGEQAERPEQADGPAE